MVRKVFSWGVSSVAPNLAKGLGLLLMLTAMSSSASAITVVPEVDPGSMATCVALLVSGMMLFAHSRWSADKASK